MYFNPMKCLIVAVILIAFASCNNTNSKPKEMEKEVEIAKSELLPAYKSVAYIDSFMNEHRSELTKNNALRERYEKMCTKNIRPLIDKGGLYDDLPFELIVTAVNNNKNYGNFVFSDGKHFIKVQCLIKESQLSELKENETYFIKFKTHSYQDGVTFKEDLSGVDLPVVNAYLQSFKVGYVK